MGKILVWKPLGNRTFKIQRISVDNIKIKLRERGVKMGNWSNCPKIVSKQDLVIVKLTLLVMLSE